LKKRGQETTQAGHDANAEEEQTKKFFAVYWRSVVFDTNNTN
jgi:hypothetical protein